MASAPILSVHEGPQNISKRPVNQPLKPGMICSNEPGYYKTGEYGIRIENLVVVTEPKPMPGGERPMMGFETITLAPIDLNLVEPGAAHRWRARSGSTPITRACCETFAAAGG